MLSVSMMGTEPSVEAIHRLLSLRTAVDDFAIDGREMYWLRRSRESRISGALLERTLGQKLTARNITTVRSLAAKLSQR